MANREDLIEEIVSCNLMCLSGNKQGLIYGNKIFGGAYYWLALL